MYKAAVVFPVLPGKDAQQVAEVLKADPAGYTESRRRLGVHMERAYEMPTPMGTFLISYIESDSPFAEIAIKGAQSALPVDRAFAAAVQEVHGFDVSAPPPGPPPEVIGEWEDETVTARRRGLAFCAPVMPGTDEVGHAFGVEAFVTRRGELTASRRAIGGSRELVCLNTTPAGQIAAVYLEADDPVEENRRFAASQAPFDVWFKQQCTRIFPPDIDFNVPLPPVTEVFDSQEILVAR